MFAFLFCLATTSLAQSTSAVIADIRAKYQHSRNNLKNYTAVHAELDEESAEGGEAKSYYDGKTLKVIEVSYFGETGKSIIEYYFDNRQLYFVYERNYTYNRPIYWDKKRMQENNDTEVFDRRKTIVKQNRYYFHKEKLVRWLDDKSREVDLSVKTNITSGQELIVDAYKIRDKLSKQ